MFDTRWKRIPEDSQVSKQMLYRYSLIKERKLRLREGRSLEGRGQERKMCVWSRWADTVQVPDMQGRNCRYEVRYSVHQIYTNENFEI